LAPAKIVDTIPVENESHNMLYTAYRLCTTNKRPVMKLRQSDASELHTSLYSGQKLKLLSLLRLMRRLLPRASNLHAPSVPADACISSYLPEMPETVQRH